MLTVTRVEMNIDMAIANVYVSVVGEVDAVICGLRKAAGYLRGRVGRAAGLQRAPELRFFSDQSIDMSEKIAEILRDDAERARGASRDVVGSSSPPSGDEKAPVS
jgi:ribosome-binding factor A